MVMASKGILRFPHPEVTIVTLDEWEVETVSLTVVFDPHGADVPRSTP